MKRLAISVSVVAMLAALSAGVFANERGGSAKEAHETPIKGTIAVQRAKGAQATFPDLAKVSLFTAVDVAQKNTQGKVLKTELEEEDGFLVYDIEVVKSDHQMVEVEVDAGNGAVLRTEIVKHHHHSGRHQKHEEQGETNEKD